MKKVLTFCSIVLLIVTSCKKGDKIDKDTSDSSVETRNNYSTVRTAKVNPEFIQLPVGDIKPKG